MPTHFVDDIKDMAPERDIIIRDRQNAVIERMQADLGAARCALVTTGSIVDGLTCDVEQGKFRATLDLGRGMGGDAAGPSPGFYARASVVACVGMAIKMLAAREGLVFRRVDVEVEMDIDDAALFGLTPSSAAPLRTRVGVRIKSNAPPQQVQNLVDRALEMSPWYRALRDAQVVASDLEVSG